MVQTKLFSDLYLDKFLNTLEESFFPWVFRSRSHCMLCHDTNDASIYFREVTWSFICRFFVFSDNIMTLW